MCLFVFLDIGKKPKPLFEAGLRNPPTMVNHTLHYPKTCANNDLAGATTIRAGETPAAGLMDGRVRNKRRE